MTLDLADVKARLVAEVDRVRFEGNVLRAVGEIARTTGCPDETRTRILRACGKEIA